jgi:hypothetical protein
VRLYHVTAHAPRHFKGKGILPGDDHRVWAHIDKRVAQRLFGDLDDDLSPTVIEFEIADDDPALRISKIGSNPVVQIFRKVTPSEIKKIWDYYKGGDQRKNWIGVQASRAQVVASLVKAGHCDLADQLVRVITAEGATAGKEPELVKEEGFLPLYRMKLRDDRFVHFLPQDRVLEVARSGKLLMKPPYQKFGPDKVYAVSAVWGTLVPGTQVTHIRGELAAISFRTTTKPESGFPEEVIWNRDVVLKDVRILNAGEAKRLLAKTPMRPQHDEFMIEYK